MLRNAMYPAFLTGPLYLLKHLGLDYPSVVQVQPYLTQSLLVILNDYFVWRIGKKLMNKDSARYAMLFLIFNRIQNEYIVRCFANSLEQVLTVVAFYYYIDQKDRLSINTVLLTGLVAMAFVMRPTCVVGWLPLLSFKVLFEGAMPPFVLSAVFIGGPILFLSVYIDTAYYNAAHGTDDWVITMKNFLETNVVRGLSKYFGEDPWYHYLLVFCPAICTVLYPVVLLSHYKLAREQYYLVTFTTFYVVFFSVFIPHKELRFLLPVVPFVMLVVGRWYAEH